MCLRTLFTTCHRHTMLYPNWVAKVRVYNLAISHDFMCSTIIASQCTY